MDTYREWIPVHLKLGSIKLKQKRTTLLKSLPVGLDKFLILA